MQEHNELIDIAEFARIIGASRAAVEQYIRKGLIPVAEIKQYISGRKRYKLSRSLAERIVENGGKLPQDNEGFNAEITGNGSTQMFSNRGTATL